MEDILKIWMSEERWPGLVVAIQVIIFLLCLRIIWVAVSARSQKSEDLTLQKRAPFIFLRFGLVIAFLAILVYQATWQLGGHFRPNFVEFMQTHDKREDNPAHQMVMGRILDRNGGTIAESRIVDGKTARFYPYGKAFAHPVGHPRYTPNGLERLALHHLAGIRLKDQEDFAQFGGDILINRPASGGEDLKTTLDINLQLSAFEAIGEARGAATAMLLPQGDILTMVSTPAFDPNSVDSSVFKASREEALLMNRNTAGMVPPGSVFKVAMAALALELGITPIIDCPGEGYTPIRNLSPIHDHQYNSYRRRGREWKGHGQIGLAEALRESSNIYFARLLVENVKAPAFNDLINRFKWREPVTIFESPSGTMDIRSIRVDSARTNDPYALAQMSIGQGTILANPGHMLLLAAGVANDGWVPKPRIDLEEEPSKLRTVLTKSTSKALAAMMKGVVEEGTASGIQIPGLEVAGKTGSAQNPRGQAHGWFIGFAPVDNPKIAVSVMIENGGSGSSSALPVAKAILEKAQELGYFTRPYRNQ